MAEKEVAHFPVRSDRDGQLYTAMEYQTDDRLRRPRSRFARIEDGPPHYKLEDGRGLDRSEDDPNAFQISDTDEIVRKV